MSTYEKVTIAYQSYQLGNTVPSIADNLSVPVGTVYKWLRMLGLISEKKGE